MSLLLTIAMSAVTSTPQSGAEVEEVLETPPHIGNVTSILRTEGPPIIDGPPLVVSPEPPEVGITVWEPPPSFRSYAREFFRRVKTAADDNPPIPGWSTIAAALTVAFAWVPRPLRWAGWAVFAAVTVVWAIEAFIAFVLALHTLFYIVTLFLIVAAATVLRTGSWLVIMTAMVLVLAVLAPTVEAAPMEPDSPTPFGETYSTLISIWWVLCALGFPAVVVAWWRAPPSVVLRNGPLLGLLSLVGAVATARSWTRSTGAEFLISLVTLGLCRSDALTLVIHYVDAKRPGKLFEYVLTSLYGDHTGLPVNAWYTHTRNDPVAWLDWLVQFADPSFSTPAYVADAASRAGVSPVLAGVNLRVPLRDIVSTVAVPADIQASARTNERLVSTNPHVGLAVERSCFRVYVAEVAQITGMGIMVFQPAPALLENPAIHYHISPTDYRCRTHRDFTDDSILVMEDTDHHMELNAGCVPLAPLMVYCAIKATPVLMYAILPRLPAGRHKEAMYTFDANGVFGMVVDGGASYHHKLWNWNMDTVTFCDRGISATFDVVTRRLSDLHVIVLLTVRSVGLYPNTMLSRTLERLHPVSTYDGGTILSTTSYASYGDGRSERVRHFAIPNFYQSYELAEGVYTNLLNGAAKGKVSPHDVSRALGSHDAAISNAIANLLSVTNGQMVRHTDTEIMSVTRAPEKVAEAKHSMRAFMKPLTAPNVAPGMAPSDTTRAVANRLMKLRFRDVSGPEESDLRLMDEYADEIIARTLPTAPWSYAMVIAAQPNASEKQKVSDAVDHIQKAKSGGMIKKEGMVAEKPGRLITTFSPADKVDYGPWIYPIMNAFKAMDWYGFGKHPTRTDVRIAEMLKNSGCAIESDYKSYDATHTERWKVLWVRLIRRLMDVLAKGQPLPASAEDFDRIVRMVSGYTYKLLFELGSGKLDTSVCNGSGNSFICFVALRLMGHSPAKCFDLMDEKCLFAGDDGLICLDIVDELQSAAERFNFILEKNVVARGDPVSFLARIYPDWDGNAFSHHDMLRQASKFHMTTIQECDADNRTVLVMKAASVNATDSHTPGLGQLCHLVTKLARRAGVLPTLKQALVKKVMSYNVAEGMQVDQVLQSPKNIYGYNVSNNYYVHKSHPPEVFARTAAMVRVCDEIIATIRDRKAQFTAHKPYYDYAVDYILEELHWHDELAPPVAQLGLTWYSDGMTRFVPGRDMVHMLNQGEAQQLLDVAARYRNAPFSPQPDALLHVRHHGQRKLMLGELHFLAESVRRGQAQAAQGGLVRPATHSPLTVYVLGAAASLGVDTHLRYLAAMLEVGAPNWTLVCIDAKPMSFAAKNVITVRRELGADWYADVFPAIPTADYVIIEDLRDHGYDTMVSSRQQAEINARRAAFMRAVLADPNFLGGTFKVNPGICHRQGRYEPTPVAGVVCLQAWSRNSSELRTYLWPGGQVMDFAEYLGIATDVHGNTTNPDPNRSAQRQAILEDFKLGIAAVRSLYWAGAALNDDIRADCCQCWDCNAELLIGNQCEVLGIPACHVEGALSHFGPRVKFKVDTNNGTVSYRPHCAYMGCPMPSQCAHDLLAPVALCKWLDFAVLDHPWYQPPARAYGYVITPIAGPAMMTFKAWFQESQKRAVAKAKLNKAIASAGWKTTTNGPPKGGKGPPSGGQAGTV